MLRKNIRKFAEDNKIGNTYEYVGNENIQGDCLQLKEAGWAPQM